MPTPRPVVIIGAGGFGREVLDIVEALQAAGHPITCAGFLDDGAAPGAALAARLAPVLGVVADLDPSTDHVIAVGAPSTRAALDPQATQTGSTAASLWHPAATGGADNRLGPGLIVAAGARLTTNISAGRHLHVNLNATLGHDVELGDYVTISPGVHISGQVQVGSRVLLGTGAAVIEGISIGDDVVVGAGAVVTTDVADGETVVGVPARPTSRG